MDNTFTVTPPHKSNNMVNFTKMIELQTKAYLAFDRKNYGCWSMKEVIDTIQHDFGSNAGDLCRAYILKTRLNIQDITQEVGYIDRTVAEARQQGKLDKFFKGKKAVKAFGGAK